MNHKGAVLAILAIFLITLAWPGLTDQPALAKGQPPKQTSLTIWHLDQSGTLDQIASDFQQAYPNIQVQLESFASDADLYNRYMVEAVAGGGPDLLLMHYDWIDNYASKRLILPVDGMFDLSPFVPQLQEAASYNGRQWGVPADFGNHLMLFYNKNLVTTPMPDNTDEWIALAQSLTTETQMGLVYNVYEPYWHIPWLTGHGGWVLDDSVYPAQPMLDTPEAVAALQFVQDLRYTYGIVPTDYLDYGTAEELFVNGTAAMIINGDWALNYYLETFGDALGIAMLPTVSATGLRPQPMVQGTFYMFNANQTKKDLETSQLFVNFASSMEEQLLWPQIARRLPALQAALADPLVQEDPILQVSAAQAVIGRLMPVSMEMFVVWEHVYDPLVWLMDNTISPADAAATMQAEASHLINVIPLNEGWEIANLNGFDSGGNYQIPALAEFNGYLYAGVWNASDWEHIGAQIWRSASGFDWQMVDERLLNGVSYLIVFDDYLYAGSWDGNVWRSADGLTWEDVTIEGYDLENNNIQSMAVYQDQLYFSTWNGYGAEFWRTPNGTDWEQFQEGFVQGEYQSAGTASAIFNGMLYYGVGNWPTGAEIWRTDGSAWTQMMAGGFGDPANWTVSALEVYRGSLYASMYNSESVQVWRTTDGTNWTEVVSAQIQVGDLDGSTAMEMYNGSLYLAVGSWWEGVQVWRSENGTDWTQVAYDGLSDWSAVFVNFDGGMTAFDGHLYLGVTDWDGGEVWRYGP